MTRVNFALLLALVFSAIFLIGVQYESRRLFAELEKARSEKRRLETEFERLQVQRRAEATPGRVEQLARDKLQMRQTTPGITTYVSYSASSIQESVP